MTARVIFLQAWIVGVSLFCAVATRAEAPVEVGSRSQLFIDQRFIAESQGIALRMNPAQKLGLILDQAGQPFPEFQHVSRVFEDQGKIRLYIGASGLSVLESDDGVRFAKTGHIIPGGELPTIFLDPHDPDPVRRYKLFWFGRLVLSAHFSMLQAKTYDDLRSWQY